MVFAQAPALTAPVNIRIQPEDIKTNYPLIHSNKVIIWNVQMCNRSLYNLTIAPETVEEIFDIVPYISTNRAALLLTESYRHNKKLVAVKISEYLIIIAVGVTGGGLIAVTPKIIAGIASSIPVVHMLADKLKAEVPDLTIILENIFDSPVVLQPAGSQTACVTRIMFSSIPKDKRVLKSYERVIDFLKQ